MEHIRLTGLIRTDRIFLDVAAASSPESTVRDLAFRIRHIPEITDFEQYVADVCEKDNLQSSGVGYGVAFTYARSNAVDGVFIALARLSHGVDFASFDREPVKLVFLMGVPQEQVHMQLALLSSLARVLSRERTRRELLSAGTPSDVIRIFSAEDPAPQGSPA